MSRIREQGKGRIEILVDTDTSKENVMRAAKSKGWEVQNIAQDGSSYRIVIRKD